MNIFSLNSSRLTALTALVALLALGTEVSAQPTFGNPSPTAGSSTSDKANAAADSAAYREVDYVNKATRGPALAVIPGDVKSNNATFMQKFGPNNIADFAELELSNANFPVLERSNLGNLLQEVSLAYNRSEERRVGKEGRSRWSP